jgi:hypothetical protein
MWFFVCKFYKRQNWSNRIKTNAFREWIKEVSFKRQEGGLGVIEMFCHDCTGGYIVDII